MLDVSAASAVDGVAAGRTVELSISGMTCAACAARVEQKLSRIAPGVVAAVSFATEQATVTAPEDIPVQAMIAAVEGAGYAADVIAPAARGGGQLERRQPEEGRPPMARPPTCAGG